MKIVKKVSIKNYIGIDEKSIDLGKINVISGKKGIGKTTIIEGIEKALTNNGRRTEVIRHGESEATLFVQLSDGLEVDRKIRSGKADYLKVSKPGESVPSTEAFLRKLIKGDIFSPMDFIRKKPDEQAKIILDMLEIPWTMQDIQQWFGEIPSNVNFEVHILKILKQIEKKYYDEREAVNREIKVLEAQVKGIRDELPANYDGEEWRNKNIQDYYDKVAQANEINKKIATAKAAIEGLESKIKAIEANGKADKEIKKSAFNQKRNDAREFIQFLKQKIEKAQIIIDGAREKYFAQAKSIDDSAKSEKASAEIEYQAELQRLKAEFEKKIKQIDDKSNEDKATVKAQIANEVEASKEEISKHSQSIAGKEQELLNVDELEKQALNAADESTKQQIELEISKTGNYQAELEKLNEIDTQPLTDEANKVVNMQSYLREFDRMKDIMLNKLAPRQENSNMLTGKIELARELPMRLLQTAKVPIDGISVDGEGMIRVNGTLIDGLSDGEKKEFAMKVAKAQCSGSELKLIVFDGFQDINPEEQAAFIEDAKQDDYQWFILKTDDGDLNIEIIDFEEENTI